MPVDLSASNHSLQNIARSADKATSVAPPRVDIGEEPSIQWPLWGRLRWIPVGEVRGTNGSFSPLNPGPFSSCGMMSQPPWSHIHA